MGSMSSGDRAGMPASREPTRSHRRPGPSKPRFWESVREDPRQLLNIGLVSIVFVFGGSQTVISGGSLTHRVLGVGAIGVGILLLASYALHFHPSTLDGEWWSRSRSRRAARAVLRYTFVAYYVAIFLGLFIWLIVWVVGRL
jgi:hypothetical protein